MLNYFFCIILCGSNKWISDSDSDMTSVSCQVIHALFHQPTVTFYDISIMPSDTCTISPANCYILWHQYHAAWCMHYFTSQLLHSMTSVSCRVMHALFHQPTVTFYDISIMHYFTSRLLHSTTSVSCRVMHALFHQLTVTFYDISIMPSDACTISPADCYILWHQYHAAWCMHYFTSQLLHSMTSVSCRAMHALFHQPTVTFYDISIMPSDACTISPADCYILWHQYHAKWCMHYFTSQLLHSMTSVSCRAMHALFHQPTVTFYDISIMPRCMHYFTSQLLHSMTSVSCRSDACTISPADCYILWHQYHAAWCMHYFTSQLLHSMTSVSCQVMHALFHQPTVTFYDISIMPRCMHYFTSQLLHSMTSVSCRVMHALFHQPTVTFYDISIMPRDACTISPANCYILWHQYHAAWCMHYFTSRLLHSMTSVSCRVMHALFHQPTVTFYDISIMPSDACTISPADCYILWHQYHAAAMHALFHQPTVTFYDISIMHILWHQYHAAWCMHYFTSRLLHSMTSVSCHQYHAAWCMHYFTSQLLHSMTSVSCRVMHALFHQPTVTFYDISIMPRDACTISPANCYILWHQYHAARCMHYFTSQLLHSMTSVSCRVMHALFHQPTVTFYDISIMPRDACTISPANCYILWHQYHAKWCMHYFTSQLLHSMTSVSCRDACTISPANCYILWHQYHAARCMHYFTSQLLHSMTSVSCQVMHALFHQPTVTFYDISIMPSDACTISPANCYILWHQYHAAWCMHYFTSRLLHSMTSVSCQAMHALFHQPTVTFYDISIMPRDACTISPADCYILWHQYHAAWCMHYFTSQLLHSMTSVSCRAMHALFHQPTVTFYDISIMPRDACTISPANCYILWHQYHAAMHALFHQPTVTFYDISIMPSDACTISPANCYILWHQYHAAWCMHYFTSRLLHSMTSVSCRVMHALFHQPTVTFYDISIMPSDACTISPADCYILWHQYHAICSDACTISPANCYILWHQYHAA